MEITPEHNARIAKMSLGSVYPMYVTKVLRKGRTEKELLQVITWLTGYSAVEVRRQVKKNMTFATFFKGAKMNPNAKLITGMICGYRIENIENTLTRRVRYLDKLVDELAKGKAIEKILRT